MQTFKKASAGGGGNVGLTIADQQLAFGTGVDIVGGHDDLKWNGSEMIVRGSGANRFLRFIESVGQYNGGFIQFDGAANKMHFGVHPTGDAIQANDIQSMTILRSSGFVGVMNDNPLANLHINGTFKVNANSRIDPTFTDLPKLAISLPSFGGSRLGDSLLQSPSIDTQTLVFKDDAQGTQATFFMNDIGNTMTLKGFDDGILLLDITSKAVDFATVDAESTTANSIEDTTTGGRYINDNGVQRYIGAGSIVANCYFQVLINNGGLARMKKVTTYYDGSTYDQVQEIQTDGKYKFFYPTKGIAAIAADEFVIKSQLDAVAVPTVTPVVHDATLANGTGYVEYTIYGKVCDLYVVFNFASIPLTIADSLIYTLPVGCRPVGRTIRSLAFVSGGSLGSAVDADKATIVVEPDGEVKLLNCDTYAKGYGVQLTFING